MLYPNRRDVLITLGALAAGAAIGEPAPYLHGMAASTTSQPKTGGNGLPMITTKDGTQIFYKDWGPKDAQPIVFHHGWPLSSDAWDVQMLFFLANGYRVVAHDRRGHGRSSQEDTGHDMDHYASDASALCREVRRAHCMGRMDSTVSLKLSNNEEKQRSKRDARNLERARPFSPCGPTSIHRWKVDSSMRVHQRASEANPVIGSVSKSSADPIAFSQIASEIGENNILIAERLRAHDPEIVDELILRYQVRLRGYLTWLTSDRDLSEDLLQEVWMRLMTRGAQFKGDSQIGTWLFAIARNLVFDLWRKRSRLVSLDVVREAGNELHLEFPSREKSPFDNCAEIEHLIAEALSTLKPRHREIVQLRFHREMSLAEIAQITGASLSSVKTRLYRAMCLLRLQVKEALSVSSDVPSLRLHAEQLDRARERVPLRRCSADGS
jgi:RNA polymerase sigma-70 factor (ECF subfamily)